ncbi:Vesicular glutamate transporter 2 [Amphibalanus amphitrite]|uniref:Vesicular glutamate transporter 2 n=1 Tax=Amphibalanus amphitrite TaxID=1232801 RepID=A0A6A4WT52_AMPAM|nr:Vesicular glutamate transporter 2 [Amphibalanus amphitrite]
MTNPVLSVLPVRYIVVAVTFFGFIINYMLRNNLNLAIVAMVNHTAVNSSDSSGQEDGPFVWDENIVGQILGSFYYGYICTQIVGGRTAELTSVKYIYGVSLLLAGLLTFLIPAVSYWDYRALLTVRIAMGFVMGVGFPSGYALLRAWAPPNERSTIISLAFNACNIGTAITMPLASTIINGISWEAVFYIQGSFALVWFIFWVLLVYDNPEKHPFITEEERLFIVTAIGSGQTNERRLPLPWKEVMTSPPVWALIITSFCNNWGFYTLLSDLPQYYSNVQHKDISQDAVFTSLPFLLMFVFGVAYSVFSDFLRKKNLLSITNIRRLAQVVSQALVAVTLICIAFLGEYETAVETLVFVGVGLIGAGYSGWQTVPVDMAPNYSGSLVGIYNTFGSIPGFLAPLVVGALTEGHETLDRWRWCFLIPAALMLFDTVVFLACGSGEEQPWNRKYYQQKDGGAQETGVSEIRDRGEAAPKVKPILQEQRGKDNVSYDNAPV